MDKNVTMYVENEELERLMDEYGKQQNAENLNKLINHLMTRRVLVPALRGTDPQKPMPCLLQAGNGQKLFPVFSSLEHTKNAPKSQGMLNMPFPAVVNTVMQAQDTLAGIAINPFSQNLVVKSAMVKRIAEVEEMKKKGIQQVQMTEAQYAVFERLRFEKEFLPRKFFAEGKQFLMDLDERRGTYLDVLYEESYQQKRMYPYLEEDFGVMVMTVSDQVLVARIEFPNADIAPGVSLRAFLLWNEASGRARYFTIDEGKDGHTLSEVQQDGMVVNMGAAPIEGTELQTIVAMEIGERE